MCGEEKAPNPAPFGAGLTALMAGTLNLHPDSGGRTAGNLRPLPLRGHTPGARSLAPRQPPQSSAAAGTARRSRPGRREARPKACVDLGPGGLRESASRESKGRRGPGPGALGTSSPVAGPPKRCGPQTTALTPQTRALGQAMAPGTISRLPYLPRTTRPGRGGVGGVGGASRRALPPLPSKLPGTQIRGSGSGWTIARGPSPPRVPPLPITNQPNHLS